MRTFSEDEARDVFARAAREQQAADEAAETGAGLTLGELQEIGRASGLDPARVAAAARTVALGEPEASRTALGPVPTGVRRTAFLAEPPTDALWERLVADARRTVGAPGRIRTAGDAREWRNGNLRMALEPAGDGSRLSFRSDRRAARTLLAASLVLAAIGLFVAVAGVDGLEPGLTVAVVATLAAALVALRQRGWAETRERQMAEVAERASTWSAEARLGAPAERLGAPLLDLDSPGDLGDESLGIETPRRRTRS